MTTQIKAKQLRKILDTHANKSSEHGAKLLKHYSNDEHTGWTWMFTTQEDWDSFKTFLKSNDVYFLGDAMSMSVRVPKKSLKRRAAKGW
ncbi:hypothetical protein GR11A_00196 [Vibrio phage vB_VcorM_GR11A]|nr:hypothetical protein GR11A_00196 [Vibrio phage vB_VcorM_GR11A]